MDYRLRLIRHFRAVNGNSHKVVFEDGRSLIAYASEFEVGYGVAMDPAIQIGAPDKPLSKFIVGDHSRLFAGQILSNSFVCGDYVTIHQGVWCYGRQDVVIGHNSWFGMRCTIDAEGGFRVGNGFGAGQDTHLWSHIRHGDVLQGSKYLSFSPFIADDDVWFVGRCTSSPGHHQAWSVALTESNIVKPMESNHVYGGNPAVDLTDKIGAPYDFPDRRTKQIWFARRYEAFRDTLGADEQDQLRTIASTFNVELRTYVKTNLQLEIAFMRHLLPEAKFVPANYPVVS